MNKVSEWFGGLIGLWLLIMLPFLFVTMLACVVDYEDTCKDMSLRRIEYVFPARHLNCWVWGKTSE